MVLLMMSRVLFTEAGTKLPTLKKNPKTNNKLVC